MSALARPTTVLAILTVLVSVHGTAQTNSPQVAVLRSHGAHSQLSPDRVALALRAAADQLNWSGDLPRVVVVLGCKESASVAEIRKPRQGDPDGAIEVESKNDHKIYYLWLLADPTDELLARGVVRIVADHGKIGEPSPNAVARVLTRLSAQVSAADLHRGE